MLFDVLARLFSASVITTVAYTLLGGSPMDCFTVFALMFLAIWPQEWAIDKTREYIAERRQEHGRKPADARRCSKSA